ncbi:hypothetical protein GCM10023185_39470 [Hymenobacter saemangeumensis]|uniref:Uncharacterized protein n=1 Tax=Hymenobacter saemangeumensis TaxID=1084522 RepID=A0ABP8IQS1_9BACT
MDGSLWFRQLASRTDLASGQSFPTFEMAFQSQPVGFHFGTYFL